LDEKKYEGGPTELRMENKEYRCSSMLVWGCNILGNPSNIAFQGEI
jgi:hypothetical protein